MERLPPQSSWQEVRVELLFAQWRRSVGLVYFTAPLAPGKSEEVLLVGVCFALCDFFCEGRTHVCVHTSTGWKNICRYDT